MLHSGIAERAFAWLGPAARPVRAIHDGIAALTHRAVGTALHAGALAVGALASPQVDGRPLDASPPRPSRWPSSTAPTGTCSTGRRRPPPPR
ncbi:hypothetical protein [Trujillonella humicola]|uniref:hypothetical protein n=1 Tax=Trujillonella humicola TaxID=3383699 RepID=UPI0039062206